MIKIKESSIIVCSYEGRFIGAVKDILNTTHKRNYFNTLGFYYNCFGYAFQTYLWLEPILTSDFIDERRDEEGFWYSDEREMSTSYYFPEDVEDAEREMLFQALDEDEDDLDDILFGAYDSDKAVSLMTHNILSCFPDVRLIHSFDELADDEYGIIMRTKDADFHFVRYNPKSGRYSAKNGAWGVTHADNAEVLFEDGEYYYGETLFAKKRH